MPPVNVQVVLLALSHPAYNVDAACELKIIKVPSNLSDWGALY